MTSTNHLHINKRPDIDYLVYIDKLYSNDRDKIEYSSEAKGFVITLTKGSHEVEVIKIGNDQKHLKIYGKRQITVSVVDLSH